jgi:hypothetical protein
MVETPDADTTGTVVGGHDAGRQRLTGMVVPILAAGYVHH